MLETAAPDRRLVNGMSVDVEEHFQVSTFEGVVSRADWTALPSRVEKNTARLLDLFDRHEVKATFFVLGWLACRKPALVRRIAERGHEIASHGYSHRLAYEQQPGEFRDEARQSRERLQDASGQPVEGYRAASFSIGTRNLWALDALAETGFRYDSSLFPVLHDRYGVRGYPRKIYRIRTPGGMSLIEVPPTTLAFAGATLPVAGGGYLRIYPYALTRWAIQRLNRKERSPAIVYVHPWEVDPGQPRIRAPLRSRFRHYTGMRTTLRKLGSLMRAFDFAPLQQVIEQADPSSVETFDPDGSSVNRG